jgi:hypothetical protein
MGGQNQQVQNTNSVSQPWAPAQGTLQGILGSLAPLTGNASLSPVEQSALATLGASGSAGNPYAGSIGSVATNLLSSGGATNQAPFLDSAYQNYAQSLTPFARGDYSNPATNPALQSYLDTIRNQVTNQVNGMFAGAGRDLSGENQKALASGIAAGEAPVLLGAYNQGLGNELGAISDIYGGANTTGTLLSNLQQQALTNQGTGINAATAALQAGNWGPQQQLAAAEQARSIPLSYLQALTGIATPIGRLGGQTSGSATTTTQVPLVNQIAGGLLGGTGLLGNLGAFGNNGWLYGGNNALLGQ